MKYTFVVASNPPNENSSKVDYLPAIHKQTDCGLYEISNALTQKENDLEAIEKVSMHSSEYNNRYIRPIKGHWKIDSGGYKIITGSVPPGLIPLANQRYHFFQQENVNEYDEIFSLDISFIRDSEYAYFNTVENIYNANKESLSKTIQALQNIPELIDKLYLVDHFKEINQYEIFCKLDVELDLKKYVRHRALGGMVGIKDLTDISFSPFIFASFRSLLDYMECDNPGDNFKFHYLGINGDYDRFTITYFDKLFQRYLGENIKLSVTYDTIYYFASAMRMNNYIQTYSFINNQLVQYDSVAELPDDILKSVYPGSLYNSFINNIETKKNTNSFADIVAFVPLNIYSEMSLDRFFEFVIDQYELVDLLFRFGSFDLFEYHLDLALAEMLNKYPRAFTKHNIKSIKKNLEYIFVGHKWYRDKRDEKELDRLSRLFIKGINCPPLLH